MESRALSRLLEVGVDIVLSFFTQCSIVNVLSQRQVLNLGSLEQFDESLNTLLLYPLALPKHIARLQICQVFNHEKFSPSSPAMIENCRGHYASWNGIFLAL